MERDIDVSANSIPVQSPPDAAASYVPAGTSAFGNALIWFGAAVSIAEILTGTLFAPLGLATGIAAILIGHVIGCTLFFLAGLIGARERMSSMETARISFGRKGAVVFSVANISQLVGWTAVMIASGAAAAQAIVPLGSWAWCAIIGAFILLWIAVGIRNINKINVVAISVLFLLTVVMSRVIFPQAFGAAPVSADAISFGAAVELGVAMPLSWLPLVSDYTREAANPGKATVASAIAYFFGSCWMYAIGLALGLAGAGDSMELVMMQAGLGIAALVIVVFSTVTTTFLDAYSAGVSSSAVDGRIDEKKMAMAVCAVGTLLAIFAPVENFEGFLYLIGSIFAPMVAILISDYFILGRRHARAGVDVRNMVLWVAGFVLYRIFMGIDTPVGNTLPVMAIIIVACVVASKLSASFGRESSNAR